MVDAKLVKAGFDLFIKLRYKDNPDLMHFTLTHERRHIAETNVMREIRLCSQLPRLKFNKKKLEQLIAAGASVFCDLAKAAKEKELMSKNELRRLESKAGELAETQAWVDDMAREANSTAIHKAVPGLRDAGQASKPNELELGGDPGISPASSSDGNNPAIAGSDA